MAPVPCPTYLLLIAKNVSSIPLRCIRLHSSYVTLIITIAYIVVPARARAQLLAVVMGRVIVE